MKAISHIRMVLGFRNYLIVFLAFLLFFWIFFSFLLGLHQLPWNDWERLQNSVVWTLFLPNMLFIVAAGILNGLLITLAVFRLKELREKKVGKEAPTGLVGLGLTGIFAACPLCGFSVLSVFGISFLSSFILPYYAHLQALALLIVLIAVYWTANKIGSECKNCSVSGANGKNSVQKKTPS